MIGLGRIEGPEDVILDRDDNLYARLAPRRHHPVLPARLRAHGGLRAHRRHAARHGVRSQRQPLRLHRRHGAVSRHARAQGREGHRRDQPQLSLDQRRQPAARSPTISTSRDDGRIFFSEATVRYEMHEWATDGLEARGNGRIICYDPSTGKTHTVLRDLKFPTASASPATGSRSCSPRPGAARVKRYWFDGPKTGTVEIVHREPAGLSRQHQQLVGRQLLDVAGRHALPGARSRAGRCRASAAAWPSACRATNGCSPTSTPAACSSSTSAARSSRRCGTSTASNHPMITSMREHRGYLYLGGIMNNRIGRYKIPGADPDFVQYDVRWGRQSMIAALADLDRPIARPRRCGHHACRCSTARSSRTTLLEERRGRRRARGAGGSGDATATSLFVADGARVLRFDGDAAHRRWRSVRCDAITALAMPAAAAASRWRSTARRCASSAARTTAGLVDVAGKPLNAVNATRADARRHGCWLTDGSQTQPLERWSARSDGARSQRPRLVEFDPATAARARSPAGLAYAFGAIARRRRRCLGLRELGHRVLA